MSWTGSGKFVSEDRTIIYSREEKHETGVGQLFSKETEQEAQNKASAAMHFFAAKLLSIAVRTYSYVYLTYYHLQKLHPMI